MLIFLFVDLAVTLSKRSSVYYADEGKNVSVECYITCTENSSYTARWLIQIPNLKNYGEFNLEDKTTTPTIESKYGVTFGFRNETVSCTSGNEARFFLDIAEVNASMSHSVVHCGEGQSTITYSPGAIYIIVHQIRKLRMKVI